MIRSQASPPKHAGGARRSIVASIRDDRQLQLVLGVTACLYLVQVLTLRTPMTIGEPYLIAKNIVAGLGYSFNYPLDPVVQTTCYIPPLYTYIAAAMMWLGAGDRALQAMNLLMLAAANVVLYLFLVRILPRRVAFFGFLAASLWVPSWFLSADLEPNALNILLIVSTVSILYALLKSPHERRLWIATGILFGLSILVRPDILLGALFFFVWLVLALRKSVPVRTIVVRSLAVGGIALAMVLPWTIRNYVTFHRFILVSANSGYNLYVGNNEVSSGELQSNDETSASAQEHAYIMEFSKTHHPLEQDSLYKALAIKWIAAHPGGATTLAIEKFFLHWWKRKGSFHFSKLPGAEEAYKIGSFFLLIFGFTGLAFLRDPRARSLILTLFLYSTAVSVIFFVQGRHRALKVDPILVPLAVFGAAELLSRVRGKRSAPELVTYVAPNGAVIEQTKRIETVG